MSQMDLRRLSVLMTLFTVAALGAALRADDGDAVSESAMKPYAQAFDKKAPKIEMVPIKGGVFNMGGSAVSNYVSVLERMR